ncbi:type III secretion system translocon subunit SctB [Mesorhizobium sp. ISC15]|uniref:type III secretion system translocon subunit SctB n=1 Tax=Mesorhizobium sp. ISC15 TaxID=3076429 RepID=UPI00301DF656
MLHTVVQANDIRGPRLPGRDLDEHWPFLPMFATSNGMGVRYGELIPTPADLFKLASAGSPTLEDIVVQNNGAETALGARLASVDIYAVDALLHSLSLKFREFARLDRQAARDCDIAAQEAAAKALRASGICELVGTLLTSAFAIAGAGVSIMGASKAQTRFDAKLSGLNETGFRAHTKLAAEPSPKASQPPPVDQNRIYRALRASGIRELVGTFLTSAFAIAGARVSTKGASKAQTRLDAKLSGSKETSFRADLQQPEAKLVPERSPEASQPPPVDLTRIYRAQQVAHETTMIWSGLATGMTEVGKIPGAALKMGATSEQEKKAKLEAEGTKMRSRADDESEFKSAYEKMIQDVLDKLSEMRRADADTRSKIVNMG